MMYFRKSKPARRLLSVGPISSALGLGVLLAALAAPAGAVVVSTTTGNTTAPPDAELWEYVGQRAGDTGVYLGNRWAIASNHTGAGNLILPSGDFALEPGSSVRIQNPTGLGLSMNTDLVMFRLAGDPGLPGIPLAAISPSVGDGVLMIGRGRNRAASETAWNVDETMDPPVWSVTVPPGEIRGFTTTSNKPMRWGTNIVESDDVLFGESDPGNNYRIYNTSHGHVIALATEFNESGGTPFEAQAVSGDSGGAVYFYDGALWRLAGIMNSAATFPGQPEVTAVYGNATMFFDLSLYREQIEAIRGPIIPEPGALSLAVMGIFLAAAGRLFRSRRQG